MNRLITFFFLTISVLIFLSCEPASTTSDNNGGSGGGSGSEVVGNAQYDSTIAMAKAESPAGAKRSEDLGSAAGKVLGTPVIDGGVYIFRTDFQADITKGPSGYFPKVHTDDNGDFRISSVSPGSYILEINDGKGKSITTRVNIDGSGDQVSTGTLFPLESSSLRCNITHNFGSSINIGYAVYILGTRNSAGGDENNLQLELNEIPTGSSYSVKVELTEPFTWSETFTGINFSPGQILDLDINLPDSPL